MKRTIVNNTSEDEFCNENNELKQIHGIELPITSYHYKWFLDADVGECSKYYNLVTCLETCTENDVIEIMINSRGGLLFTAIGIINSIRNCKGMVIANIVGECHSAASLIALSCDDCVVQPMSSMLIHSASGSTFFSKYPDVYKHTDHMKDHLDKVFEVYQGFLTEKEIKDVKEGKDIWLTCTDIQKRLDKRKKLRNNADIETLKGE